MTSTAAKVCFFLLILHSFPKCLAQLALALFRSACPTAALIFTMVLEDHMVSKSWRVLSNKWAPAWSLSQNFWDHPTPLPLVPLWDNISTLTIARYETRAVFTEKKKIKNAALAWHSSWATQLNTGQGKPICLETLSIPPIPHLAGEVFSLQTSLCYNMLSFAVYYILCNQSHCGPKFQSPEVQFQSHARCYRLFPEYIDSVPHLEQFSTWWLANSRVLY